MLFELSIVTNRARDEARAAAREGFWLWLTDIEAYQRHRSTLDPTLLNGHQPADLDTRPWMRTHDAGVRHCLAMDQQLSDEAALIAGMLDAASTVAVARESESQETLNALMAVAALGLGIPALVLAYYGADRLLPLNDWRRRGHVADRAGGCGSGLSCPASTAGPAGEQASEDVGGPVRTLTY